MAYDPQRGGGRGYGQQAGGYINRGYGQRKRRSDRPNTPYDQLQPIEPENLPINYVNEAERVMKDLREKNESGRFSITTSKIRAIHTLVMDIYNTKHLRTEAELLEESQLKLMRLYVRIVYDAGREQAVTTFLETTKLLNYIKGIGNSRAEMIRFAHYMEALVAYHRFMGGKEN